ncbi:type IX secretion system membrane protein PorP/SprF [Flavobacterium sp. xlx-214]|uniref:PorP/SprF family type IX secretion system membrane protein n=1 Tax=unclassified Flavobacterium TaxID=196869 RepID=UPI0013CFBC65|nr:MULTISPECIES: type IX secretion system membrane protein PorP/SprF [unclassified Flavobacterium]MBA5793276.1 type IX secretion system membrane protein PorP/SprF [Flavobacterium sp. xlx-221]QMI84159.1 type IX secretion system membrane protein PorP/SprF [Flavobacterium sp. xlx-214]
MNLSHKITKILMGIILLGSTQVQAQQDPQYTNYMYNTVNINPAYAGSRGALSIFGLHRTQWVGLEGAPTTNSFSVNTPIQDSKLGVGLSFVNDKLGVINENTISLDVSYTIDLNQRDSKLSFGVKGSLNMLNVAYSRLNKFNPNDPMILHDISDEASPNIGAGIYWHNEKSYVGLSVPNFLENKRFENGTLYSAMNQRQHFYLMGGHVFEINPTLKFKPAFLLKAVSGAPLQADVTANFLIHDKLTLGAAYRWDAAWSALAGFQVTDGLMLGYSYDSETTKLGRYNNGSHELFVRFELFNKYRRVNSPRFY